MTTERPRPARPSLLSLAFSDGVPRTALVAALLVGSVLNLINQGDVLWGQAALNLPKMLLTYCVPYCVATWGAVSAKRRYLRLSAGEGSAGR
jgi:hypothetical protein